MPVVAGARDEIIQRMRPSRLSQCTKEHGMADADEVLVGQSQAGDSEAFEELVRRHQHMIHSLTFRMTGSPADAEDLAQESFIRAYGQIGSYRGEAKFSTWLFGIACNEWRQHARGRKELALDELDDHPPEAEHPAAAASSNLRLDLAEAMKRLTDAERAAIVLCCQNGLTHDEAAQALSCPLGTVKTNVLRGKEKLRKWLSV